MFTIGSIICPISQIRASRAEMVTADRDLRLRGYEVFRFGGSEFDHPKEKQKEAIEKLVSSFFERNYSGRG